MGIFDKITQIQDTLTFGKRFSSLPNCYDFVVVAGKNPNFKAIKDREQNTLYVFYDKYIFKKNDQIIDESDISYFVKDVDSQFEYCTEQEKFSVQKITYEEKPLSLPTYLSQNINTNIHIDASSATLNDITVNNSSSQHIDYNQLLNDLENTVYNCYHIKEYKEMIAEIKECIKQKKPVVESKFKKFFKFMGTQVKRLFDLFVVSYASALALKS